MIQDHLMRHAESPSTLIVHDPIQDPQEDLFIVQVDLKVEPSTMGGDEATLIDRITHVDHVGRHTAGLAIKTE